MTKLKYTVPVLFLGINAFCIGIYIIMAVCSRLQGNSGEVGWKIGSRGINGEEDVRNKQQQSGWKQHAAPTLTL
jgi:hypothetical protein